MYKEKADLQHTVRVKLSPKRGTIYDRNERVLALDTRVNSVYAVAREITDKKRVAAKLADLLKVDEGLVFKRLSRDKAFVWIKRKINNKEESRLIEAHIPGVALLQETKRSYPHESLFCHVVGFTDIDNKGLEGLELTYDIFLTGRYGWKSFFRDARRNLISSPEEYLPARQGYNLVLTVDDVIQDMVESEIERIAEKHKPRSIIVIAMEPETGALLAMASYPNYDPNDYKNTDAGNYKNRVITDTFEPGSVFKVFTASAVLEEKVVSVEDKFFCEQGNYRIGKRTLRDYRPYGTLTFQQVIEKSSNIGTVKAAARLGKDKFYEYILKFGFGAKCGIDLSGEENGIVRHKDTWRPVDMTTIPMGQGISCTALQLANAVSAIANGGDLMKPYIVDRITDNEGNVVRKFSPQVIRKVMSENAAAQVRGLMNGVVLRGTGKRARLDGYAACGKTGTAQKVGVNGRYSKDKYVASFIGFAPYQRPLVSLVVCVNEPKGSHFGGTVSAPAFKNIMQKILKYLEVEPDENNES